jgi:hypothetical protein
MSELKHGPYVKTVSIAVCEDCFSAVKEIVIIPGRKLSQCVSCYCEEWLAEQHEQEQIDKT